MSAAYDLARALDPHALQGRKSWQVPCPVHEDRNPSLSIRYADGKVLVHCHAGCKQQDVIAVLRDHGLWPASPPRLGRSPSRRLAAQPRPDQQQAYPSAAALAIWRSTVPASGTPVESYLATRGLTLPLPPSLHFHRGLKHRSGGRWPAMVARVTRGTDDTPLAIHRTFLAADGAGKAQVEPAKMMLGSCRGGAVHLAEPGDLLMIGEGIETCLSVMQAQPGVPVWAALSSRNLEQVVLPPKINQVVILADNDGAGLKAAAEAAARFHGEGRRVLIAHPPAAGEDFNDLLLKEGPDAVRRIVEAAEEWRPEDLPSSEAEHDHEAQFDGHKPVGFRRPTDVRPELRADDRDLAPLTDRVWKVLRESNTPPWLYRSGGPAWVERDDDGRPALRTITEDRLRHVLAQVIDWRKEMKDGGLVPAYPPSLLVKNLLATPDPALPVLTGIVTAPVFGQDGTLITDPGYHRTTRLLYEPAQDFDLPPIPERPTPAQITAARELLLNELLGDFPFIGEAERAHAVALLLLPFVRPMISGPTPLHLIEKPTPGTGATLMVDAISIVTTGMSASVMVEGRDEDEWRKRLTAKLREMPPFLLIDNLRHKLDASSVAAALTAPYWEDRVLGKSEMTRFPIRCVWVATGNNPQFSNELARRMVRIRLDPHEDQPWLREDFRHPNLLAWVRQNRARLVAACLTLGRAWITAERPRHQKTIGSFENWSQVMGGILEVAGVPGFLGNLKEMYERADAEGQVWRVFVAQWWERHSTKDVGVADLFDLAVQAELPLTAGDERAKKTSLGRALVRMRDRIFAIDDLRLRVTAAGSLRRAQRWELQLVQGGPGTGSQGSHAPRGECEPRGRRDGGSHEVHTEIREQNHEVCEPREPCEPLSPPRAHAHTRALGAIEEPGKSSPGSQGSQNPANPRAPACEPPCEPPERGSHGAGGRWEELI